MFIRDLFASENIELYSLIGFSDVRIINQPKYDREIHFFPECMLVFAVPYRLPELTASNISEYAIPRDYHLYMRDLFSRIIPDLENEFQGFSFRGYSDSSPFDERFSAAAGGLGIIGDNGMLITEKYGSYVFLGSIVSDASPSLLRIPVTHGEIGHCGHCGACKNACPMNEYPGCLSGITQKKGVLSPSDYLQMKKYGTVWGCDICQKVCPRNAGKEPTPIAFFREKRISYIDCKTILDMSESEFGERAYSWRGRDTILRNIINTEKTEEKEQT